MEARDGSKNDMFPSTISPGDSGMIFSRGVYKGIVDKVKDKEGTYSCVY